MKTKPIVADTMNIQICSPVPQTNKHPINVNHISCSTIIYELLKWIIHATI